MKKIIIGTLSLSLLLISWNTSLSKDKLKSLLKESYAFVPSGIIEINGEVIQVDSFYTLKTELTNFQYLEFLASLKKEGKMEEYHRMYPDTNVWKGIYDDNRSIYFTHPAYRDYPVVGVSLEQTTAYCQWLGEALSINFPDYIFEAKLPSREEWLIATKSDVVATYAWGSNYVRNHKGQIQANFVHIRDENLVRDPDTKKIGVKTSEMQVNESNMDLLAPVKSYWPSKKGIYNLNGNAAELTSDGNACGGSWRSLASEIQNESFVPYQNPTNDIGFRPIFRVKKKH